MILYGRAKHFSKVTLQDHQKHLIWTSAHDDRHDEEWEKPIVSTSEVTQEIIDCPVVVPIITVRVEDTGLFGTGWYLHKDGELFAISVWHEDRWKDLIYGGAMKPRAVFVSVPKILGVENVRFVWENPEHDKAFRVG
jgi:hypothetical protein